jgi:septin family protein
MRKFFFLKKKFENCKKYLIQKIEKKNIKIYKKYSIYTKNIANFNQKNNSFPF